MTKSVRWNHAEIAEDVLQALKDIPLHDAVKIAVRATALLHQQVIMREILADNRMTPYQFCRLTGLRDVKCYARRQDVRMMSVASKQKVLAAHAAGKIELSEAAYAFLHSETTSTLSSSK